MHKFASDGAPIELTDRGVDRDYYTQIHKEYSFGRHKFRSGGFKVELNKTRVATLYIPAYPSNKIFVKTSDIRPIL